MANKPIAHIAFDQTKFRQELKSKGINIRSLGNPESPNYIGLHQRTIRKGLKDGWFSVRTLNALSKIIDIDTFVIDTDYQSSTDNLVQENAKLKLENDSLRFQNEFLKNQLRAIRTHISSILGSCIK